MAILDSTIIKGDLKVLGKIKEYDSSGINFSTAEQIYGTWIDGKTIYWKTIQYSGSLTSNYSTIIGSLGGAIDNVIKIDRVIRNSNNTTWYDSYETSDGIRSITVSVEKSSGNVSVTSWNENWGSPILNVIIYYTK